MPRSSPSLIVEKDELEKLFIALGVWDKINDGRLSTGIIPGKSSPANNPIYSGGLSEMVRLLTPIGLQIGTTHRITLPDGSVPHWCAHDLLIGEIILWRL